MVKIKYPINIFQLLKKYSDIFDEDTRKKFDDFFSKPELSYVIIDFNRVVLSPFHTLFDLSNIEFTDIEIEELEAIMCYGKYRKEIASFFMKYKEELHLLTCFYCNMDYIFVYDCFMDLLDFVKHATITELVLVPGIGTGLAKEIIQQRSNIKSVDELTLPPNKKQALKDFDVTSVKSNHFTLDHIIDKATHPLFSLSFYNLLPSCYVCNSKLKHAYKLILNDAAVSPTHKNFLFDELAVFKLFFSDEKSFHDTTNKTNFKLELYSHNKYTNYTKLFKLNSRYQFHKSEAIELIKKTVYYSESQLKAISDVTKIHIDTIRQDIFGKEVFIGRLEDKPLTKYKRDVARQIGIINTAKHED